MTALIFCLALLFVFVVALTSTIVLVARNARDAEREDFEIELDQANAEIEECRQVRVDDARYINRLEISLASAGKDLPGR